MTLFIAVVISALNQAMHTGGRVAVALTAVGLGASPFIIGTIAALYGLLPMALSVWVGKLNDRIGPRTPMMAGTVLFMIAGLVSGYEATLAKLYITATCIGVGNMMFQLSIQNTVGRIGGKADLTKNFSTLAIGMSAGAIVGPLIAGYAIDYAGYEFSFIFLTLCPLAAFFVVAVANWKIVLPEARNAAKAVTRTLDLLAIPGLFAIYMITGLHVLSWELFTFLMPVYGSEINLSASTIGIIMGAFSAASFAMRLLLPPLAARINHWTLIKGMILLGAVTFALLPVTASPLILVLLAAVIGACMGAAQPLTMTLIHDNSPPGRIGESLGVRTTVVCIYQFANPLIFGALGSLMGLAPVFWVMAGAVAVAIVAVRTPK